MERDPLTVIGNQEVRAQVASYIHSFWCRRIGQRRLMRF